MFGIFHNFADDVDAAKTLKQFDLRNDIAGVIAPNGKTVGGAGKLSDFDFALQLKDNAVRCSRAVSSVRVKIDDIDLLKWSLLKMTASTLP